MQGSDPVLDPDVIAALKELGGDDEPGLFHELVELFLDDTLVHLRALTEALERCDAQAIERTAHTLKSSSGNIGAARMSRACAELERLGKQGRLDGVRDLVQRTGHHYEEARAALRAEPA